MTEKEPRVSNGLSLCSIHHRAFDQDLVGVSPDYEVRVHPRLLDEIDCPMLELLKDAHDTAIVVPRSVRQRRDRELLAVRFERFQAALLGAEGGRTAGGIGLCSPF